MRCWGVVVLVIYSTYLVEAQPLRRFDRVFKLIAQTPQDSTLLKEDLQNLCKYGPRPLGSLSLENAENYLTYLVNGLKLKNTESRKFDLPVVWQPDTLIFECAPKNSDAFGTFTGFSLAFTPHKADVNGILVDIGIYDPNTISDLIKDIKRKVVMIGLPQQSNEETQMLVHKLQRLLEDKGAAGIVYVSWQGRALARVPATLDGSPAKIPALTIPLGTALVIRNWMKEEKILGFITQSSQYFKTTGIALSGNIKGSEYPKEKITVTARIDTWDNSPGAADNTAGCVVIAEAARILQALKYKPRRSLEFVWFNAGMQAGKAPVSYPNLYPLQEAWLKKEEKNLGGRKAAISVRAPMGVNGLNLSADARLNNYTNHITQQIKLYYPEMMDSISNDTLLTGIASYFLSKGMPTAVPNSLASPQRQACFSANCDNPIDIKGSTLASDAKKLAMYLYAIADADELPKPLSQEEIKSKYQGTSLLDAWQIMKLIR